MATHSPPAYGSVSVTAAGGTVVVLADGDPLIVADGGSVLMSTGGFAYTSEEPPSYDQATNPAAAPPSYDSLYGEMRQVQSAKGFLGFLLKAIGLLLGTMAAAVCIALINIIPIAMIVIGWLHLGDCPAEPFIPIWLIVGGAVSLIKSIVNFYCRASQRRRREAMGANDDPTDNVRQNPLDGVLSCFLLGWFIAGSVWVFKSLWPNFERPSSAHYCDQLTYMTALIVIGATYALLAAAVLFVCCCGCCVLICFSAAAASAEVDEQQQQQQAQQRPISSAAFDEP